MTGEGQRGARARASKRVPRLVRNSVPVMRAPKDLPEAFESLRNALPAISRALGVELNESPAPGRVAPYALAISGEIREAHDPHRSNDLPEPLAAGRLVVLHDPAGQDGWDSDTRFVAFARAVVEDDIGRDPMAAEVGWTWLSDALDSRGAVLRALGGTVTVTSSRRFGLLAEGDGLLRGDQGAGAEVSEIEIRASWSLAEPLHGEVLLPHLQGWCVSLAHLAGRPPSPLGVITLRG